MNNIFPLVLYLPFPPSVNSYYVRTRNGVFISKKGRKFRDESRTAIYEQGITSDNSCITELISLSVILYPPDKRIRDLDNCMKGLQDTMSADEKSSWPGVYVDDKQIDQVHIYRGAIVKGGKTIIIIKDAGMCIPNNCEHIIVDNEEL